MNGLKRICLVMVVFGCGGGALAEPDPHKFVPGEVLVQFQPSASAKQRRAVLHGHGARVIKHFEQVDLDHLALPDGTNVKQAVASLLASGNVVLAQPNYIRHISVCELPNDPYWLNGNLWGPDKVQAHLAWQQFCAGDGSVVVGDLDTGVNYNHLDLAANIWTNALEIPGNGVDDDGNGYIDDVHGIDTVNHDGDPMDDHGHGTHTSGTVAAVGNNGIGVAGVSWNAKIIPCKCFDNSGNGKDADIVACFDYLIALKQRGVNVRATNNSYSGKLAAGEPFPAALKAAFDAAGAAGIVNVCAAGNDSTNNDVDFAYPAAFDSEGLIAVAGSDGDDNRISMSNFGATTVDLAAPGVWIVSTIGVSDYGFSTGTSMAAPHVTGAAVLLANLSPSASVATIKSLLLNNVDVRPQLNGLVLTSGRLNVFKAAQAAVASTQNTLVTAVSRPASGEFDLTWNAVPGVRYQVWAGNSLTSGLAPVGPVMVAGGGQTSLTFTDSSAMGSQKFYRVQVVP